MSTQNMYLLRASKKEIQPGNMHLCYGASMINPMIQKLDPFLPRFDSTNHWNCLNHNNQIPIQVDASLHFKAPGQQEKDRLGIV